MIARISVVRLATWLGSHAALSTALATFGSRGDEPLAAIDLVEPSEIAAALARPLGTFSRAVYTTQDRDTVKVSC